MSHRPNDATNETGLAAPGDAARPLESAPDARKPYEPPKIIKRRSVVQATLFSAMGPSSAAQTMSGN